MRSFVDQWRGPHVLRNWSAWAEWRAGKSIEAVASEFGLSVRRVQEIVEVVTNLLWSRKWVETKAIEETAAKAHSLRVIQVVIPRSSYQAFTQRGDGALVITGRLDLMKNYLQVPDDDSYYTSGMASLPSFPEALEHRSTSVRGVHRS